MNRKARILYVGDLTDGGTCRERMLCLQEEGHDVVQFDTRTYSRARNVLERILQRRLSAGPVLVRLNRALRSAGREAAVDWVWIDRGVQIYSSTLEILRGRSRPLIHYTADPAFHVHTSRHFRASLSLYSVMITTKQYEVPHYRRRASGHLIVSESAFGRHLLPEAPPREIQEGGFGSNVSFVGHTERHYRAVLGRVAASVPGLAIWGNWARPALVHPWVRRAWRGREAFGRDYKLALAGSKISLGLLCKFYPDTVTTRTFEIAAAGVFLLAERTEDHLRYFEEGKEAEFFGGQEELIAKLRHYLADERGRTRIAAAGQRRAMADGYSYQARMRVVLEEVGKVLL